MLAFPPSPALSSCDSLADIEDLDAFLEAQGQLSHWPTPPPPRVDLKEESIIEVTEIDTEGEEDDEFDCRQAPSFSRNSYLTNKVYHIANILSQNASVAAKPGIVDDLDVRLVQRILYHAQLPSEVLALAFNIICGLNCQSLPAGSFYSAPSDLLVACAMSLAVSYTNDHAPPFSYWSRIVCDGTWTAIRIEKTTLQILAALDWRLLKFGAPCAIQMAMLRLMRPILPMPRTVLTIEPCAMPGCPDFKTSPQLRLVIEDTSAYWANGQITPEGTPPSSAFEGAPNQFLPLL